MGWEVLAVPTVLQVFIKLIYQPHTDIHKPHLSTSYNIHKAYLSAPHRYAIHKAYLSASYRYSHTCLHASYRYS